MAEEAFVEAFLKVVNGENVLLDEDPEVNMQLLTCAALMRQEIQGYGFEENPPGNPLPDPHVAGDGTAEKRYITRRLNESVLPALRELFKDDDEVLAKLGEDGLSSKTPRIALCFSGGGYRAMIGTCAYLSWFKENGLLDTVSFMAGLSGSTWCLAPWLAHVRGNRDKDNCQERDGFGNPFAGAPGRDPWRRGCEQDAGQPADFLKLKARSTTSPFRQAHALFGLSRVKMTCRYLYRKLRSQRPLSLTDIYGLIIANPLLTSYTTGTQWQTNVHGFDVGMSDMASLFNSETPDYPFPIFTALCLDVLDAEPKKWFEFTPFEVGATDGKCFVDSKDFGGKFTQGKLSGVQEDNLAYALGIWGSAFAFDGRNYEDCWPLVPKNWQTFLKRFNMLEDPQVLLKDPSQTVIRRAAAHIHNFACDVDKRFSVEDVGGAQKATLRLVDAGLDSVNIPLPPLFAQARKVDLILVCDMTEDIVDATQLHSANEKYFRGKGQPFPEITVSNMKTSNLKHLSFDPAAKDGPALLFLPGLVDGDDEPNWPPKTSCFSYESAEVDRYAKQIRTNLDAVGSEIKNALRAAIMRR